MIQAVGIVLLDRVWFERLFLFLFGGGDADLQMEERALKRVYIARIAEAVYRTHWVHGGSPLRCCVILGTFDHLDLQRLVLEDDEGRRKAWADGTIAAKLRRQDREYQALHPHETQPLHHG